MNLIAAAVPGHSTRAEDFRNFAADGLNPSLLELEVTESLLIEDAAAAKSSLKALREIGVSVALDDFGTGYSSLSYLCDFPFTRLKIDKRFVHALGQDSNADAIVTAIMRWRGI